MINDFKIVVLISGNGSTLQAIIDAIHEKKLSATITAVISSKADAYGLERAEKSNIHHEVVSDSHKPDRNTYDKVLQTCIDRYQPDLIVLAGFMRILSADFVKHYEGRIINIHPSLLPKYKGMNTYVQALNAKEDYHGTSIHFVTDELDGGPLIAQASIHIKSDDTPDSLRERTQTLERKIYPQVIEWLTTNQLCWNSGKIEWKNADLALRASQGFVDLS